MALTNSVTMTISAGVRDGGTGGAVGSYGQGMLCILQRVRLSWWEKGVRIEHGPHARQTPGTGIGNSRPSRARGRRTSRAEKSTTMAVKQQCRLCSSRQFDGRKYKGLHIFVLCLQVLRYRTSPRPPPRQGVRLPGRALRWGHLGMMPRRGPPLPRLPGALQRNLCQCAVLLFGHCSTVLTKRNLSFDSHE